MDTITGIISEINNFGKGKGSHLVINGDKYGIYDPTPFNTLGIGQEVTFQWEQKGVYKNISKAGITSTGNGAAVPVTIGSSDAPTAKPLVTFRLGPFPVDPLDGQRSIIRQNSITNAVHFVNEYCGHHEADLPVDDRLDMIIDAAQRFEAYSSGDTDRLAAEEAEAKMDMTSTADLVPHA